MKIVCLYLYTLKSFVQNIKSIPNKNMLPHFDNMSSLSTYNNASKYPTADWQLQMSEDLGERDLVT